MLKIKKAKIMGTIMKKLKMVKYLNVSSGLSVEKKRMNQ